MYNELLSEANSYRALQTNIENLNENIESSNKLVMSKNKKLMLTKRRFENLEHVTFFFAKILLIFLENGFIVGEYEHKSCVYIGTY
jgi:hypothetical protein